jgi:hypothetical protein
MRLEDMDAVIEDMECAVGNLDDARKKHHIIDPDRRMETYRDALARLREWRESAVEGWVMRWSSGPWEVHLDAEPDDHDGRGLLLTTPREER